MDSLALLLYTINVYLSVIGIIFSLIFGLIGYSVVKNAHKNLQILFGAMYFALITVPFVQLLMNVEATKDTNYLVIFNICMYIVVTLIQFIRFLDMAISCERFVVTFYPNIYNKNGILLTFILMMISAGISIFLGVIASICKFFLNLRYKQN